MSDVTQCSGNTFLIFLLLQFSRPNVMAYSFGSSLVLHFTSLIRCTSGKGFWKNADPHQRMLRGKSIQHIPFWNFVEWLLLKLLFVAWLNAYEIRTTLSWKSTFWKIISVVWNLPLNKNMHYHNSATKILALNHGCPLKYYLLHRFVSSQKNSTYFRYLPIW